MALEFGNYQQSWQALRSALRYKVFILGAAVALAIVFCNDSRNCTRRPLPVNRLGNGGTRDSPFNSAIWWESRCARRSDQSSRSHHAQAAQRHARQEARDAVGQSRGQAGNRDRKLIASRLLAGEAARSYEGGTRGGGEGHALHGA